ncbi:hypothetical protein PVAP13_5NG424100 [Panicum virgatum]|uniref:Homeobox domain-containing protein n=1 Tax=Panicum virgatum TaxID=38727 RepID=A0A8T0S076_PANVG|nr:hypothetical protein PVAP13_5NG424100 [Panicum virgatum]
MASSFNNRHWPSMFRSKHAAEPWQAQPDISGSPPPFLSGGGNATSAAGSGLKHPSSGFAGGEERTPDPKPRWNPKPEQIRILEAIFNSGMVNPPRDEIPRIRMRLLEYGQVGDANVFYWFQNRKSRSKNKLRTAGTARAPARGVAAAAPVVATPPAVQAPQQLLTQQVQLLPSPAQAPTSSSSSSSDRSSGSSRPAAKRAAQEMSSTAAMDLLGPLAAAWPQMYYQGQPVAPTSAPAHKVQNLVSSDEPIFQPWQQGYCLSAAEVAAIIAGQYMPVPVQQQPPPSLPAGAFLGLCNEVTGPAITGQRNCAWGAGLGQYCTGGGSADHHQLELSKNTTTAAAANAVAREVAHEDSTKLGLLPYCFGDSTAVDAASVAATSPLAATPDAAVTVASVAASTAGLAGLPASTVVPNGVVASYDLLQLQGLAADGALGVGAVTTTTTGAAACAAAAVSAAAAEGGVAALCVTDTATGKSVAHTVAAARLDVRAQFGEAAVLFRCAGERGLDIEQVPVDASGRTVQPLQHGAFYYVLV